MFNIEKESFNSTESIIPLYIYQTWHTKELPPKMQECVQRLINMNPEFQHALYDEVDCRDFIKIHFGENLAAAYDKLVPKAFKADLWRYCVLYINGGVYLDIKYSNVEGFKLIELINNEYFVKDIEPSGGGIYNAFIVCKPRNPKLLKCIQAIENNVANNYYGESLFHVTGPLLLKQMFTKEELDNLEMSIGEDKCPTKTCVYWKNRPILQMYKEYRDEQQQLGIQSYPELWVNRKIYND